MEERRAYVTVLSTDSYLPGVMALFESIKRTNPKVNNFAVVVNENIKAETKKILEKEGIKIIVKDSVTVPESIKKSNQIFTSNWNYTFDKFNLFDLGEFDKIVYLDSDMYVKRNIDELFDKPNMSGVVAGKSYPGNESWEELNSGLMVIEPKKGITAELTNTMLDMSKARLNCKHNKENNTTNNHKRLTIKGVFKKMFKYIQSKGDQDIFEEYFNWKNRHELELDEKYNILVNYADYYINHQGYSKEEVAVIHFLGVRKPWMMNDKLINVYRDRCKRENRTFQLEAFDEYIEIIKTKQRKVNMYMNKENRNNPKEVHNKKHPTFSIIIPMKNADKWINDALNSIAIQEFEDEDIEVLVIDDNSDYSDISKYRVNSWKTNHPNIKLKLFQSRESVGPGGARNIGLDNAKGEYILFLDSDDKLNENALYSIKRAIQENPSTDLFVLGYQLTRCDEHGKNNSTMNIPAKKLQESRLFQIGANTAGQIWNVLAKRSLFGEKEDECKIRFKENVIFEDTSTKVNLFVRNKKKIKSIEQMTHTQYSRKNYSITGSLTLKDLKSLIDRYYEIANLKTTEPNINTKDKMYVDARKATLIATSTWVILKSIGNKLDRIKKQKQEEKQTLQDEITLGM